MNYLTRTKLIVGAFLIAALPLAARNAPRDDPRDRAIEREWGTARVGVADRDVEIRFAEENDWTQARAAAVLRSGDAIRTGPGSRAEIELDRFNLIRIGEDTELLVHTLGNRAYQLELVRGVVNLTQWDAGRAEVFVDAPRLSLTPLKHGVYRIDSADSDMTIVTVRKGESEVLVPGGARKVKKGKRLVLRGDEGRYSVNGASEKDSFDEWVARRDDILEPPSRRRGWGPSYLGFGYGYGYPYWGYGHGYGPRFYGGYSRVRVVSRGHGGFRRGGRGRR